MLKLTGKDADKYDIYYRVHAQNYGWLAWAKNGEAAGTSGYAYRLEAIQIVVTAKGDMAPTVFYGGYTSNNAKRIYQNQYCSDNQHKCIGKISEPCK